jgi:hypothetical protein
MLAAHVAGPPEKEPADTKAGWRWAQRCLRCDCEVYTGGAWWKLGSHVYELEDGRFTTELPPGEDAIACLEA